MDLSGFIREGVRRVVEAAGGDGARPGPSRGRSVNVASAVNVDGEGSTTAVYSDGEVTVIRRDGNTEFVRHRPGRGPEPAR